MFCMTWDNVDETTVLLGGWSERMKETVILYGMRWMGCMAMVMTMITTIKTTETTITTTTTTTTTLLTKIFCSSFDLQDWCNYIACVTIVTYQYDRLFYCILYRLQMLIQSTFRTSLAVILLLSLFQSKYKDMHTLCTYGCTLDVHTYAPNLFNM